MICVQNASSVSNWCLKPLRHRRGRSGGEGGRTRIRAEFWKVSCTRRKLAMGLRIRDWKSRATCRDQGGLLQGQPEDCRAAHLRGFEESHGDVASEERDQRRGFLVLWYSSLGGR